MYVIGALCHLYTISSAVADVRRHPARLRTCYVALSNYPHESEGVCFHRRWFVCLSVRLSVTTITKRIVDGFVPNFMLEGSYGKREDQVRVSLRSVKGCGSSGQKTP